MATNITLYRFSGDERILDKGNFLTQLGTATLVPSGPLDLLNPTFTMKITNTGLNQNWNFNCNYLYIAKFDAFYFVDNFAIEPGSNVVQVSCHEDVLYTYIDEIRGFEGLAVRSEGAGMTYVTDKQVPIDPNRVAVDNIYFSSAFTADLSGAQYVLTVN